MNRLMVVLFAVATLVGCKTQSKPEVTEQDVYNEAKMTSLPTPVRASFNRDHPGAAMISSEIIHTATGPAAYQITYREANETQQAWYREDGSVAEPAEHR